MTVIAMTREMGTRGKDVAAAVAEALNLEVVHHELVERQLAERLQVSEQVVHRFLEGEASLWDRWKIDTRRVSQYTSEEILELAMRGNVLIRGWGAAQLLRDVAHVICVRVCAPMNDRVAEMKSRLHLDDEHQLRREIERNDEGHERAVRAMFQIDWRDPVGYNIVVNTARISINMATELLLHLARSPAFAATKESQARLADKLTLARVRAALDSAGQYGIGGGLDLSIDKGVVTVKGVAMRDVDLNDTINAIKGVDGVAEVRNDVQLMPYIYGP